MNLPFPTDATLKKYGLTLHDYETLWRCQHGVCAVCRRPPKTRPLAIDHDHKTGRVRGLLCYRCNRYLVGQHTVHTARAVLDYLECTYEVHPIDIVRRS